MEFPRLNLPDCPLKVRPGADGKPQIWDPLRSRYVALTPEEYVRQRFTAWLASELHYPLPLMANEVSLNLNGLHRRADTLVYDRHGDPFMVVEYKAPQVPVTQAVFDQAVRYNIVLGAPYLAVTNGLNHYCCRMEPEGGVYHFIPRIPDWRSAMLGPIDN